MSEVDYIEIYNKFYHRKNSDDHSLKEKEDYRTLNLKLKVLNYYSKNTMSCSLCGYNEEPLILQLDHIYNNGAEQRKAFGNGNKFYRWIIKNNYPEGFQVLCPNCNWKKMPHIRKQRIVLDYWNYNSNLY